MRLPALLALAALVGLSACDSAKMSELTGAKPAKTQIAAAPACPPAATVGPVCPPAPPAMAPEAAKPAPTAVTTTAKPSLVVHRARNHTQARAWAHRHPVKHVRQVVRHRPARTPVRHFAYAGGYTGEQAPHLYAPRGEVYAQRHARGYERREDSYAQDGYRYDRRDSDHAPYVDERREDSRGVYRYQHREGSVERSGSSSSYEHREDGYSSGSESGYVSGGTYGSDCNCRPQAAGRDRQGFLTWAGKR